MPSQLQRKSISIVHSTNGAWRNAVKLQFIEDQIKICEAINSPKELEYWYSLLGLHLAQHGSETRIRILLDDLLGVTFASSLEAVQGKRKSETILVNCGLGRKWLEEVHLIGSVLHLQGVEKHEILTKVLDSLKSVTKWQRIYMEYSDQLNAVNFQAKKIAYDVGKL